MTGALIRVLGFEPEARERGGAHANLVDDSRSEGASITAASGPPSPGGVLPPPV